MMYRLIIVDDEENTRSGLAEYVGWPELGYVLVGSFANGQTAIEWLGSNHADVVLTDIRMPDISGLDLAEHIRRSSPSTHVVLISGHKEFDYAHRAIEFGVKRYLLKPTRIEAVRSAFRDLAADLDAERAEARAVYQGSERYHDALPYLRDQFFWDLLNGNLALQTDIRKRAALIDLPFSPLDTPCGIVTVRATPDPFESLGDTHARSRAFTGAIRERIAIQRCFITTTSPRRYSVIFVDSGAPGDTLGRADLPARIRGDVDAIVTTLRRISSCDVSVSASRVYRSLFEVAMRGWKGSIGPDDGADLCPDDVSAAAVQRYRAVLRDFHHGDLGRGLQCFEEMVASDFPVGHSAQTPVGSIDNRALWNRIPAGILRGSLTRSRSGFMFAREYYLRLPATNDPPFLFRIMADVEAFIELARVCFGAA